MKALLVALLLILVAADVMPPSPTNPPITCTPWGNTVVCSGPPP